MLVFASLLGIVAACKLHAPELMAKQAWLTWGRIRPVHVQVILFGWLGNAFLSFLYHAAPTLAGRPVASRTVGWLLFFVWNVLFVAAGIVLVLMGRSQLLEWCEFPIETDVFAIFGLGLALVQFGWPLVRVPAARLYISGWYILGALVFTLLAYPMGNFVPELEPGALGATFSGLWIHDAVGLYVTPLAVAIAYFVIPAATGKAIFSHFLSMIAFWMLFFVYPLNGTHHYVFSPIPMHAQLGAIVASIYLGMDVVLNVTNQLLSLKGSGKLVWNSAALKFTWMGIVCYLLVSLQGSLQAVAPINKFVHFSDWVIGHAHLAMIGFASFAAIGGLLHVWERTEGLRYSKRPAEWSFGLASLGLAVMFIDLTIAGLVQGALWSTEASWMESVRASGVYWIVRSISGFLLLSAFVALGLSMTTGPVGRAMEDGAIVDPHPVEPKTIPVARWLSGGYIIAALAGVGCFLFSFVVLAIWPNQVLEKRIAQTRPADLPPIKPSVLRGQAIYGREGCALCHTQLVRFTTDDARRFGPPSSAWESARDFPQLWGTRRIGPDLRVRQANDQGIGI